MATLKKQEIARLRSPQLLEINVGPDPELCLLLPQLNASPSAQVNHT